MIATLRWHGHLPVKSSSCWQWPWRSWPLSAAARSDESRSPAGRLDPRAAHLCFRPWLGSWWAAGWVGS